MMRILGILVSLAAGPFLLTAGSAQEKDKLDGKWFVARQEEHGNLVPAIVSKRKTIVLDGGKMEWYVGTPAPNLAATITVDEEKKTIDAKIIRGGAPGKLMLGIYKFEKGLLHVCWGAIGSDKRPEKFATVRLGTGGPFNYTVYSREPGKDLPPDLTKKDPFDKNPFDKKVPVVGKRPKLADLKFTLPKKWDAKYSDAVTWRVSYDGFQPSIEALWMAREAPKTPDELAKKMQETDFFGSGLYLTSVTEKGKLPDGLYVLGKFKMGKEAKESKYIGFAMIRNFGGYDLLMESTSTFYDNAKLLKEALAICKSAKF